jgi:flagellar M-ring protein FliF
MRKRKKPSASVLVDLRGGSVLEAARVSAIVHLVSASIPELEASKVTVVDQNGRLLTDQALSSQMGHTRKQFEYTRQVEESYIVRIENILEPLMGTDGVRAQVKVELDFTEREQTDEDFSPDPIVRSEHKLDESDRLKGPMGIPGALTNQPPGAGVAPEKSGELTGVASNVDLRNRQERTRNYEIDKTIRHTRNAPGSVKRLSVAVVVDDHRQRNVKGEVLERTALNATELLQITKLVKEAVGFQASRGDTVNVINAAFKRDVALVEEIPFWEKDWFIGLIKQVLVGLFILALIFGVLTPVLRNLIAKEEEDLPLVADSMELSDEEFAAMEEAERGELQIEEGESYEEYLELVRNFVAEQPEVATQVTKKWLGAEEEDE